MNKYEFENLQVRFDGSQNQAEALRKRAEALGYKMALTYEKEDVFITCFKSGRFGFYPSKDDLYKIETYDQFMTRTEQYINAPKTSPCQAHSNQTRIVDIDGEKWRVDLVEKVNEPLTASEWLGSNMPTLSAMEKYAEYRIEHFKKHGV